MYLVSIMEISPYKGYSSIHYQATLLIAEMKFSLQKDMPIYGSTSLSSLMKAFFGKRKNYAVFRKTVEKKSFSVVLQKNSRPLFCHSHLHHRTHLSHLLSKCSVFWLVCLHFYSIWTCHVVDRRGCYRLWTHVVHNPQTQTIGRRSDSNSAPLPRTSQYCPQNTYRRQNIQHG